MFLDLGVLAAAPCGDDPRGARRQRVPADHRARADWLLAHLACSISRTASAPCRSRLLRADEPLLFGEAKGLVRGDRAAIRALARTLVLSGFGMTLCGGSFPASQGEHPDLPHYLEMMRPPEIAEALHGAQVGVAAIFCAWRYSTRSSKRDAVVVKPSAPSRLRASDDRAVRLGARRRVLARVQREALRSRDAQRARLAARWPAIRARISAIATSHAAINANLGAAGAPTTPAQHRDTTAQFEAAMFHGRELRDRYTFLDLAADS